MGHGIPLCFRSGLAGVVVGTLPLWSAALAACRLSAGLREKEGAKLASSSSASGDGEKAGSKPVAILAAAMDADGTTEHQHPARQPLEEDNRLHTAAWFCSLLQFYVLGFDDG
jgi:hypothetical protein